MYKNIGVIIPALEKNRYSEDGDLVRFEDVSLLEWKMIQVKNFIDPSNVFISTRSARVEKIGRMYGMNVIKRKENDPMSKVIADCAKRIEKDIFLWTHVTSPFISSNDFKLMVDSFAKYDGKYDSLMAVFKLQEFIIFKDCALNFEMTKVSERKSLEPVYRVTNGCFIAKKAVYLKYGNYFGVKPYLYELDSLSSTEIKNADDLNMANNMVPIFLRKKLEI